MQYAQWEEGQKDFRRARSVWERALDVSYTNPITWLKYAEMEMRHRFINHARNVWDRAVSLLPRVDQLWCATCLLHPPCHTSCAEPGSEGATSRLRLLPVHGDSTSAGHCTSEVQSIDAEVTLFIWVASGD